MPGCWTPSWPASGSVYKAWLKAQPEGFIDGVEQAALDPFRGYANAIRDGPARRGRGARRLPRGPARHPGRR